MIEPAPAAVLQLQRTAGNRAVTQAVSGRVLQRNGYDKEPGYRKCGVDERPFYTKLREAGFSGDNIKVAGPGGAGADLITSGDRLWIVEVKGGRDIKWMGMENINRTGNVPAKQIGEALTTRLGNKVTGKTVMSGNDREQVTVREYLTQPADIDVREQIMLVCTSLTVPDALLAMHFDMTGDKPTVPTGHHPYPLQLGGVIDWLYTELKDYKDSKDKPHLAAAFKDAYRLKEAWDDSEITDAREWLLHNPDEAALLEELYTQARRDLEHEHHGNVSYPTIGPGIDIKLLPVSGKLPLRRLQRKKFDDAEKAREWLAPLIKKNKREAGEKDAAYLERLIGRSPYANPPPHKTANLVLLQEALDVLKEEAAAMPTGPARKRTVTANQLNHITNGQVRSDQSPTGLHTINGTNRVCEWYGEKQNQAFGCYWRAVRSIADPSKTKPKGSTFYPDHWTIQDITDAIEYASQRQGKAEFEVQAPAKSPGLILMFNGDSYYPYFD